MSKSGSRASDAPARNAGTARVEGSAPVSAASVICCAYSMACLTSANAASASSALRSTMASIAPAACRQADTRPRCSCSSIDAARSASSS